jgi:hypothetical protein
MVKPQTAEPKLRMLGLVVAGLALAFLAGVWFRGFVKPTPDRLIAEAWGPLFNKDGDVLVSVASHSHLQVRARSTPPPESERAVDAPRPVYEWYRKYIRCLPKRISTSSLSILRLGLETRLEPLRWSGPSTQRAGRRRSFQRHPFPMFRDRNVVLIGMPENSSSIDRLLSQGSFRVLYDKTLKKETIVGPTATYATQIDNVSGTIMSYGLVTCYEAKVCGALNIGL